MSLAGSGRVTGAARQGDVGHLNIAAYHPDRSPQAAALGGSAHLRAPLRADVVCLDDRATLCGAHCNMKGHSKAKYCAA